MSKAVNVSNRKIPKTDAPTILDLTPAELAQRQREKDELLQAFRGTKEYETVQQRFEDEDVVLPEDPRPVEAVDPFAIPPLPETKHGRVPRKFYDEQSQHYWREVFPEIIMLNKHGLELGKVVAAHVERFLRSYRAMSPERQKSLLDPALPSDPRERAAVILADLQQLDTEWRTLLEAVMAWGSALVRLPFFGRGLRQQQQLPWVPAGAALQLISGGLKNCASLPPMPAVNADDPRSLDAAKNVHYGVKATMEHVGSPGPQVRRLLVDLANHFERLKNHLNTYGSRPLPLYAAQFDSWVLHMPYATSVYQAPPEPKVETYHTAFDVYELP